LERTERKGFQPKSCLRQPFGWYYVQQFVLNECTAIPYNIRRRHIFLLFVLEGEQEKVCRLLYGQTRNNRLTPVIWFEVHVGQLMRFL
jgi:hypothetical protein